MSADRHSEILVIHPGALGDVLQAVPALRALRRLGAKLSFSGQGRLGALLAGTGEVQEALPFDGLGLDALFSEDAVSVALEEKLRGFDRVVSWFGARARPYPERLRSIAAGCLVAPTTPPPGSTLPVWQHLLATLAPWDACPCWEHSPLVVPEAWEGEARARLAGLGVERERPLLLVHPGAGAAWKRWAPERFAQVIERVRSETSCQVLVHQGPADAVAVTELLALLAPAPHRLVEPPLQLLCASLIVASTYIGSDSGVSQLAAAIGARAVILYPAATRDHWAPWSRTALPLSIGDGVADVEVVARAIEGHLRSSREDPEQHDGGRARGGRLCRSA